MIISGVGWGGFLLCFILAFFFLWLAVLDILLWFFYISFFLPFLKTYLTHSPTRLFGLLGLLIFWSLYITLYICIKWGWGWGLDGDDGKSEYDFMK